MCKAFFLDTEIIPCPIVRDKNGLALSSRNLLLSKEGRKKASLIYQTIKQKIPDSKVKRILQENGFKVEYVETINGRRFIAAYLENVRLIDNVQIGS
jgi:pantoate--beta-alanine ligase